MFMTKPFHNLLKDVSTNFSDIPNSFEMINEVIDPIADEIETPFNQTELQNYPNQSQTEPLPVDEDQAKAFREGYILKINQRCKAQLDHAVDKCYKAFADAYDRCWAKLPTIINTVLCWPVKVDSACKLFKMGDTSGKLCDPSQIIDRDFGDKYAELKAIQQKLRKQNDASKITINLTENSNVDFK